MQFIGVALVNNINISGVQVCKKTIESSLLCAHYPKSSLLLSPCILPYYLLCPPHPSSPLVITILLSTSVSFCLVLNDFWMEVTDPHKTSHTRSPLLFLFLPAQSRFLVVFGCHTWRRWKPQDGRGLAPWITTYRKGTHQSRTPVLNFKWASNKLLLY